jgi:hypothetical protein
MMIIGGRAKKFGEKRGSSAILFTTKLTEIYPGVNLRFQTEKHLSSSLLCGATSFRETSHLIMSNAA